MSFALSTHYLLNSEAYDIKTFNITNNRILKPGKSNNDIRILDKTAKEPVFTTARWASFLLRLNEIDNVRRNNMQTYQDRHRSTTRRMVAFQAGHRQSTPPQPKRRQLSTVHPHSRPHNSTKSQLVSRMQRVSFNPHVTVDPADDYDRTPTWMYIALDRARFRGRIQQTELILSPILSNVHRIHNLLQSGPDSC